MRVPRIFQPVTLSPGQILKLDAQATIHLTRVLRLRVGDALVVFNGMEDGGEYEATVWSIERRTASVQLGKVLCRKVESSLELLLVQGISRGERMDYTVQKAVELGVTQILPVVTERTGVNLSGDRQIRRQKHWQAVTNAACEQSGRTLVPEVKPVMSLKQWLDESDSNQSNDLKLVLHHRAENALINKPRPAGRIIVLIGPEGGLAPEEIAVSESAGYVPLCLGPRILRTETAAVAAFSILQWLWGDLAGNE